MSRTYVVHGETDRITLPRGEWIEVKRRLNYGERRQLYKRSRGAPGPDGTAPYDPLEAGLATILGYLLDWSLTDTDRTLAIADKSEAAVQAVLESLHEDIAVEILRAIETHEAKMTAERTAEKNAPAGETSGSAISLSPSGAAGPSSPSAP